LLKGTIREHTLSIKPLNYETQGCYGLKRRGLEKFILIDINYSGKYRIIDIAKDNGLRMASSNKNEKS